MVNRLDKLFDLLYNCNSSIRSTAISQIAELCANSDFKLDSLLNKLLPYVHNRSWTVRIAASEVIYRIGRSMKPWVPNRSNNNELNENLRKEILSNLTQLNNLDLLVIIKVGSKLYSSENNENYSTILDSMSQSKAELKRQVGLSFSEKELDDMLVKDTNSDDDKEKMTTIPIDEAISKFGNNDCNTKKAAKRSAPSTTVDVEAKMPKLTDSDKTNDLEWYWSNFSDELIKGLWSSKWEIRHGSASGLRELLRTQGHLVVCKGWRNDLKGVEFETIHEKSLEDIACKLLCTLVLDEVSDFVTDEMVAPVRETCAQALALLCKYLSNDIVFHIIIKQHLLTLLSQDINWKIRHSVLLCLKYILLMVNSTLLSSNQTMMKAILDPVYNLIDSDHEEMRCAAANLLSAICDSCTFPLSVNEFCEWRDSLWSILRIRLNYVESGAVCALLQLVLRLYSHSIRLNSSNTESVSIISEMNLTLHIGCLLPCLYNYDHNIRTLALDVCQQLLEYYRSTIVDFSGAFLCEILNQLFQILLLECSEIVISRSYSIWSWIVNEQSLNKNNRSSFSDAVLKYIRNWIDLCMQIDNCPFALHKLVIPVNLESTNEGFYIGGKLSFFVDGDSLARKETVLKVRMKACEALGQLIPILVERKEPREVLIDRLIIDRYLTNKCALERFVVSQILSHCFLNQTIDDTEENSAIIMKEMKQKVYRKLVFCLQQPLYYNEIVHDFSWMLRSCKVLRNKLAVHDKLPLRPSTSTDSTLNTMTECRALVIDPNVVKYVNSCRGKDEDLVSAFNGATASVRLCALRHNECTRMVELGLVSASVVWSDWNDDSFKLTPIIKPLLEVCRNEERKTLQNEAALTIAYLIYKRGNNGKSKTGISKLMKNITSTYAEALDKLYPIPEEERSGVCILYKSEQNGNNFSYCLQESCIISINPQISYDENFMEISLSSTSSSTPLSRSIDSLKIKHHGFKSVLVQITKIFIEKTKQQDSQPEIVLNVLCDDLIKELIATNSESTSVLDYLIGLEVCLQNKFQSIIFGRRDVLSLCQNLVKNGLSHLDMRVRHWSARVIALLILFNDPDTPETRELTENLLLSQILSDLQTSKSSYTPQYLTGLLECLYLILCHQWQGLETDSLLSFRLILLPLCLSALLNTLNSCTDHQPDIQNTNRKLSALIFSELLIILPLEGAVSETVITKYLTPSRIELRKQSRQFIDGLLKAKGTDDSVPLTPFISVNLRRYQQIGVDWLMFLNKYRLHGVLADDMGLGKTLQTLSVIVATSYHESGQKKSTHSPSLIVCPSTLTRHWSQEVVKFIKISGFSCLVYSGSQETRLKLIPTFSNYDLVIISYDLVRQDVRSLSDLSVVQWHYVVLDEGHLIRNHKSKLHQAVKMLRANNRLILTGTPIQNKVSDLWSLFDFLMPGLLGYSHGSFMKKYKINNSSPCNNNNDITSSNGNGSSALKCNIDLLHKQILPFLMRRVKEDVIHELPPKIIQDYTCVMSDLQQKLYNYVLRQSDSPESLLSSEANSSQRKHVFQTLHTLRLICNHPSLVLNRRHPLWDSCVRDYFHNNPLELEGDIVFSGKLLALKQLILDCGIGLTVNHSEEPNISNPSSLFSIFDEHKMPSNPVVSNHRLLIFCQSRKMIRLVEEMISFCIPKASFLRIDGSVSIKERQNIVDRFQNDPTIDMLLLTTGIGSLGLNLSCADTVIFVEHDYNPMRDLQAMDRAHRIGQKAKVVMVYRLIMAQSIEESIMNVQQFKMYIANCVVSGTKSTNSDFAVAGTNEEERMEGIDLENIVNSEEIKKNKNDKTLIQQMEKVYEWSKEYSEEFNNEAFIDKI